MWVLPGCCKDSFNLSIPPCPQQLLETEGLKTPRAETHKSRLGWNRKEEELRGRTTGTIFITNMEHDKGLAFTVWEPCQSFAQRGRSLGGAATWVCNASTAGSLTNGSLLASLSKCHD